MFAGHDLTKTLLTDNVMELHALCESWRLHRSWDSRCINETVFSDGMRGTLLDLAASMDAASCVWYLLCENASWGVDRPPIFRTLPNQSVNAFYVLADSQGHARMRGRCVGSLAG